MKDYAKDFYQSEAWKTARLAYLKKAGGLCELCLEKGLYKPGVIVHHKEHITPENITDESITLSFDNLQLVCQDCHNQIHSRRQRRYKVDEYGRATCRE